MTKNISDVDKNFKIETHMKRDNLQFHDIKQEPFRIYGLLYENERFCRIPGEVAKNVNDGVMRLHTDTAGGRVRFITNSPYVAISAKMDGVGKMSHFPLTGRAGFDMYVDEGKGQKYQGTFTPPFDIEDGYESCIDFLCVMERTITINFPLYSNVKELYIGLDKHAVLKQAADYKYENPIVYYGSSITQGGCASRPGNSYQSIISRRLDANYINLGFSGSARAEKQIVQYMADMEMSMLVCDYDHNAPDATHLQNTHLPLYQGIREKQPNLPIIFISAPDIRINPETYTERRKIIRDTFETAVSEGDDKVYFIDGEELFEGEDWDSCTVDRVHPNDLGFYRMARCIEKEINYILTKIEEQRKINAQSRS